ncbi:TCP-1/Cpn60 chaperonin family protein [Dictyocaulus viviparus]|uniref:TCP-1/Cpn60 chaperonin family protein n=1 Tax=Dictyocaulus viviparus TaxID=29172 RepID=A0A0D8XPW7_DICVI|nr:TCP-1/Cpn60 chaperonin family protein [Dictyocaulus viviparus]
MLSDFFDLSHPSNNETIDHFDAVSCKSKLRIKNKTYYLSRKPERQPIEGEKGNVATILIRGSSQSRIDDVERAVDDAINTYKALTKDGKLLPGAGAVEIELARQIENYGEKCSGLEQYAIKKFAYALETLPKCIAENSGMDATDILTKLNAAHEAGHQNAGIDIWKHDIMDASENNIFDLYCGKKSAIKLATDAATTILKVDQIIIAKQATGGPKPRGQKSQDEEDEGMA